MFNVEHLSTKCDYAYLTKEYQYHDKQESSTTAKTAEGTLACEECFGIEQIPKLHHDEDGEEHAQFVSAETAILSQWLTCYVLSWSALKPEEEYEEYGCHSQTDTKNEALHRAADDESSTVARTLLHDRL